MSAPTRRPAFQAADPTPAARAAWDAENAATRDRREHGNMSEAQYDAPLRTVTETHIAPNGDLEIAMTAVRTPAPRVPPDVAARLAAVDKLLDLARAASSMAIVEVIWSDYTEDGRGRHRGDYILQEAHSHFAAAVANLEALQVALEAKQGVA